ncbi:hypothetical protein JPSP42_22330 [Staphylococcus pseudintermedius]
MYRTREVFILLFKIQIVCLLEIEVEIGNSSVQRTSDSVNRTA